MGTYLERLVTWADQHVQNAVRIVLIPLVAYLVIKGIDRLIRRLEKLADEGDPSTRSEREKRVETLGRILRQVVAVFVWGIAAMSILSELGISIGPIMTGAGIAGLAVGFGAQTLVKDVIAGFFVLLENQFRVRDVITTGKVTGTVEAINLRTTVLRDDQGRVHVVPNGSIDVVTNHTRDWSRAVLDVGVAYKEDVDRVFAVLREVGDGMELDPIYSRKLTGRFEYPGIQSFGDSAVVVRMQVKTQPQESWDVTRELRRRVKRTFDERGIEIPYPHLTLDLPENAERLPRRDRDGSGA